MNDTSNRSAENLRQARALFERGDITQAERRYREVFERDPGNSESVNVLAMLAHRRGDQSRALSILQRGISGGAADELIHYHSGLVFQAMDRLDEALASFDRSLAINSSFFVARLHRGLLKRQLGRSADAVLDCYQAILSAQLVGRWLGMDTTAVELHERVRLAMDLVAHGRRVFLDALIDPFRAQLNSTGNELSRFEHCLSAYLGELSTRYADQRQLPTILYFPDLPASPFVDRRLFPSLVDLEAATDVIRIEMLNLQGSSAGREAVFQTKNMAQQYLSGQKSEPVWDGYYFFRHGKANESNLERCPVTAAQLKRLPLVRITGQAPEVMFSTLGPGTHLHRHRGITNARVVMHLPLTVPKDCALVVADERHDWQEGKVVVFDDTYEHEAWNRSDQMRVVLIADLWSPYLTAVERDAISLLSEGISNFERAVAQA